MTAAAHHHWTRGDCGHMVRSETRNKAEGTMAGWRDQCSPQAQDDLDELLGVSLGFAQQQLAEHGEFYPFATAMNQSNQIELIPVQAAAANDHPDSANVAAQCERTLTELRSELRAAAITTDVRVGQQDAIQVRLEHSEGTALVINLGYLRDSNASLSFGQLTASAGALTIWKRTT